MRIPLAVNLESRDGGVGRDAKVANGLVESRGQDTPPILLKRPGLLDLGLIHAGVSQLLYNWNGIKAIIADILYSGTPGTIISAPSSSVLGVTVTLNPADKSADVTLSNNNLTAVASGSNWQSARGGSTTGKSSGKWYWEVQFVSTGNRAGIGNASATLMDYPGADINGWGVDQFTGQSYHSATPSAFTSTIPAGEWVGFALDMGAGTCLVYRSGASVGTLASSLTGTIYPMVGPFSNPALSVTVNFGASPFANAIPSGFAAFQTVYASGLQYTAVETNPNAATPRLFFKSSRQGFVVDRSGAVTAVSYASSMGAATYTLISLTRSGTVATATLAETAINAGDSVTIAGATPSAYNGTVTVTGAIAGIPARSVSVSITRSGTTATAVSVSPHGLSNGQTYAISGANESGYNGSFAITLVDAVTFTFTIVESPVTPATGSPVITRWDIRFDALNNAADWTLVTCFPFSGANKLQAGDVITMFGSYAFFPNGAYTIQSATTSSFVVKVTGLASSYSASGISAHVTSPAAPTISSITRSSTVATLTTSAPHKLLRFDSITISGAAQSEYNGDFTLGTTGTSTAPFTIHVNPASPATGAPVVTVPAVNSTFTYAVAGSPTTPATGTITVQGGGGTVPGIPYIDGYFNVMDTAGVVWQSAPDDPTSWPALQFLTARNENGAGKALGKSISYLVAFKEYSTEYFYNAKNLNGSPFSPVDNGFTRIGCASGVSVAPIGNTICWISQLRQGNRSVYRLDGTQQAEIATPDICRILNNDSLSSVYAYGLDLKGHPLYLLTLPASNLTLVYDLQSSYWTQWTSLTLGNSVSVSSIMLAGTTATATTSGSHGLSDGDPVKISGANQVAYNGIFQARVLSPTTFAFETTATGAATGTISMFPYTESYFKFTQATTYNGSIYLLHESDGHLYQMSASVYQDAGIPIDVFARSVRLDGGTDDRKKMRKVRFIGDLVGSAGMIRFSDDDGETQSAYRVIALDSDPAEIRKCGGFIRRNVEFRHIDNSPLRAEGLELEITQ